FELEVARTIQSAKSGEVSAVGRARELYRHFGLDPTRVRPSSEALLRRLKKGESLPRVNSLVDVANALSVQLQGPVGLYDLGKENVNVAGRICIADADGPCGNPSSDSARTMITTATERAAWIYFLPVSDD